MRAGSRSAEHTTNCDFGSGITESPKGTAAHSSDLGLDQPNPGKCEQSMDGVRRTRLWPRIGVSNTTCERQKLGREELGSRTGGGRRRRKQRQRQTSSSFRNGSEFYNPDDTVLLTSRSLYHYRGSASIAPASAAPIKPIARRPLAGWAFWAFVLWAGLRVLHLGPCRYGS